MGRLQQPSAPQWFGVFTTRPFRGRRTLHSRPGEASKLAPTVDQIRGKEPSIALDLRYKPLWVDYKTGDPGQPGSFGYNTTTHGPLVGIVINF